MSITTSIAYSATAVVTSVTSSTESGEVRCVNETGVLEAIFLLLEAGLFVLIPLTHCIIPENFHKCVCTS